MSVEKIPTAKTPYVYALMCETPSGEGYLKIGYTINIGARLTSIRTGCPLPIKYIALVAMRTEAQMKAVEKALHREFSDRRAQEEKGEWFCFNFKSPEDKKEFHEKSRKVFREHQMRGDKFRWEGASIQVLDRLEKQRRKDFINSPYGKRAIKQQKQKAAQNRIVKASSKMQSDLATLLSVRTSIKSLVES